MEKLNHILNSFVAVGHDTKDKVLGASFTIVNKDGLPEPRFKAPRARLLTVAQEFYTKERPAG